MIVYYAPGEGKGKSTRAAAICRFLDVVEVVTTFNDNEPLDRLGVPYKAFLSERDCINYLNTLDGAFIICDVDVSHLKQLKQPHELVYRYGRSTKQKYLFAVDPLPGVPFVFPIISVDFILTREEAREDLGIDQNEHLVLGVKSTARPGKVEAKWPDSMILEKEPAARWLAAADTVVGAIGLNLYSETTYLGLQAEWVALSPDQRARIKRPIQVAPGRNKAIEAASIIARAYMSSA